MNRRSVAGGIDHRRRLFFFFYLLLRSGRKKVQARPEDLLRPSLSPFFGGKEKWPSRCCRRGHCVRARTGMAFAHRQSVRGVAPVRLPHIRPTCGPLFFSGALCPRAPQKVAPARGASARGRRRIKSAGKRDKRDGAYAAKGAIFSDKKGVSGKKKRSAKRARGGTRKHRDHTPRHETAPTDRQAGTKESQRQTPTGPTGKKKERGTKRATREAHTHRERSATHAGRPPLFDRPRGDKRPFPRLLLFIVFFVHRGSRRFPPIL